MRIRYTVLSVFLTMIAFSSLGFLMAQTAHNGKYTEDGAIDIAKGFLLNGPTFRFDGIPNSVKVINVTTLRCPWTWEVQLSFSCAHSGYGNRMGQILLQVITPHVIRVRVQEGKVMSAIIDETWDELNQKFLEGPKGTVTETEFTIP